MNDSGSHGYGNKVLGARNTDKTVIHYTVCRMPFAVSR
jgi:hypothetical protein